MQQVARSYEGCRHISMSELHAACHDGDLQVIERLLRENPDAINQKSEQLGWTPLDRAVICQHASTVALLLSRGADPNVLSGPDDTPLHYAADGQSVEIVKELVNAGADVNWQTRGSSYADGSTALHKAVGRLDTPMVEFLLQSRANPNLRDLTVTVT